jgi:hypothetical protein
MYVSADYLCPARGPATLDPPSPDRLLKAARAARDLGVEVIQVPVLEESLSGSTRARIRFLDGLIVALDQIAEAGLASWLIAPASKVMGVHWAPPYLLKGYMDPQAAPVFVDGSLRRLRFIDWWADPPLISKRLRLFKELLFAVAGHPGLKGWVVLDRAFEAVRPNPQAAAFVLRSFLAEIRERDEKTAIHLGLGWSDLILPQPALSLAPLADGIRMAGDETEIPGLPSKNRLADELRLSPYVAAVALWLFEKPLEVQTGWGLRGGTGDPDVITEGIHRLSAQGVSGINWLVLVDPDPEIQRNVPWSSHPGLEKAGLFYPNLEPKKSAEEWLRTAHLADKKGPVGDFIDITREEYLEAPMTHIRRMWDHYRESM